TLSSPSPLPTPHPPTPSLHDALPIFSFARDNSGEMEDHVRLVGHQLIGLPWPGEVTHLDGHRKWTVAATLSLDDIVQHFAGDRSSGAAAIPRQALRQFLADHAGTADDQDFHDVAHPLRSFVVELPGGVQSRRTPHLSTHFIPS